MVDRIEREIEEILAKLDEGPLPPDGKGRTPIPIQERRKKSANPAPPRRSFRTSLLRSLPDINPATLLFTGAGLLVAGLFLTLIVPALIWVSFAGIVVFLSAFAWSFIRTPKPAPGAGSTPSGHYWRDRYISYEPQDKGPLGKIRRKFRK